MKDRQAWLREAQANRNSALYAARMASVCPMRKRRKFVNEAMHHKRLAGLCVKLADSAT